MAGKVYGFFNQETTNVDEDIYGDAVSDLQKSEANCAPYVVVQAMSQYI